MAAASEEICPGDGGNESPPSIAGAAGSGICPGCGLACEARAGECPQCGRSLGAGAPAKRGDSGTISFGFGGEASPRESRRPRKIPREDLLTPRDVARAFQLAFDPNNSAAPPPPAPAQPLFQLPSGASVEQLLSSVSSHARQAVRIGAVGLIVLIVTGAAVVFAIAAVRLGHAAVVSLGAPTRPAPAPVALAPSSEQQPSTPAVSTVPLVMVPVEEPAPTAKPKPIAAAEPAPADNADAAPGGSDDVRALWAAALDAESHKQFGVAVKLYDRIESLPSDCWPAGLQTRVALARQEMSAGTW